MDLVQCIMGKFLVFTTNVAREPRGKKWNYFSKVCHVILQK